MEDQATVAVLNELLALERRNLAARLLESTVFISRLSVENLNLVRRMAQASAEHGAWLAEAITELDGVPGPRHDDVHTADLHYLDLRHVLPRLTTDHENLIRKYTLAAARIASRPKADTVVSHILKRHQEALSSLNQLPRKSETPPS